MAHLEVSSLPEPLNNQFKPDDLLLRSGFESIGILGPAIANQRLVERDTLEDRFHPGGFLCFSSGRFHPLILPFV
jgi:hypothetical protein